MSPSERKAEWVSFVKAASLKLNALCSVYDSDGEKMCADVIKAIGWTLTIDLVREVAKSKGKN